MCFEDAKGEIQVPLYPFAFIVILNLIDLSALRYLQGLCFLLFLFFFNVEF